MHAVRVLASALLVLTLPALCRADATPIGTGEPRVSALEQEGESLAEMGASYARGVADRTLNDPWRFDLTVWGWLPQAPAEIELGRVDARLPEDLDTILDSLQWGAFLDLELRKGPFGIYASPILLGLRDSFHTVGPIGTRHRVAISENAILMDFGASFELVRWHPIEGNDSFSVTLEPFAGARWLFDDVELDVDPGPDMTQDVDFVAPVVGGRAFVNLTERWNLRAGGDYGGFDVDNLKETYNVGGFLGYRFEIHGVSSNVFAGYRYLYIDFEKKAELEIAIKGPLVGIGFEF
jgi:hypothetical protein